MQVYERVFKIDNDTVIHRQTVKTETHKADTASPRRRFDLIAVMAKNTATKKASGTASG
jgi:hypothetical protein